MSSKTFANQILATIDVYYGQYLSESHLRDHPIVKIAFYESMIETLTRLEIGDENAQAMVEVALRRSVMNLRSALMLALRRSGIPPQ